MELTVGQFMKHIAPELFARRSTPRWPPDMFAIAAALLQRSGAYVQVFEEWPPKSAREDWRGEIAETGRNWRLRAAADQAPPPAVRGWWAECRAAVSVPVSKLGDCAWVVEALLHLVAASDEACTGIGIPSASADDLFEFQTTVLLLTQGGHTLCREIDPSRAIVLPKIHTPQSGMTLRSLTRNLALYLPGEVVPNWSWRPTNLNRDKFWKLNLLLLPWPLDPPGPTQFGIANSPRGPMSESSGFFCSDPDRATAFDLDQVLAAYRGAQRCIADVDGMGTIDGIVFPELSLRPQDPAAIAAVTKAFVVGGVQEHATNRDNRFRNYSAVVMQPTRSIHRQAKQHRWRLDAGQIRQYGFPLLDPERIWWENIEVGRRELTFFSLNDWFTFSLLICEDLARPDPTTELLRSVGPNLVIALLMDGPQLLSRWSSRYASVLADDPGSSVLTLTSLGMTLSCMPEEYQSRRGECAGSA